MKPLPSLAGLAASLLALALPLAASAAEPSDATIAGILGVPALKHDAKKVERAGLAYTDLHYRTPEGHTVVTVRQADAAQYALWKQTAAGHTKAVAGIGQEAFAYVGMGIDSVCARSAASAACISAGPLNQAKLTDSQIQALLKAAL